jgi:hypothetical protein
MLLFSDQLEILSLALNVDMVDLKGGQQEPHSLVVCTDVGLQDHLKKVVKVVNDKVPQLLGQHQRVEGFRHLESGLTKQNTVDQLLLLYELSCHFGGQNLLIVETDVLFKKVLSVQRLLVANMGWVQFFYNSIVDLLDGLFFVCSLVQCRLRR